MNVHTKPARPRAAAEPAPSPIAPDCAGQDFYAVDRGLRDLLGDLPARRRARAARAAFQAPRRARRRAPRRARPHGRQASGPCCTRAIASAATRTGSSTTPPTARWRQIAFGDFQFHAMSHRAGVLGLDAPLPPVAKYACQYLFVQGEFGIMCPISVTDTSIYLIRKYASPQLKDYLLPRMLSADLAVHVEGHAVHDREGRRLRHRPGRDGGRATRAAPGGSTARSGSARTPTPTWR